MNLAVLAKVLEDAGLGQMGTDIFVHRMHFDVKKGIMLRLPPGGVPIDNEIPGYHKTQIQAIVRAIKQEEGDTLAKAVSNALTMKRRDFSESGQFVMRINHLLPLHLPYTYPRSEGEGLEWSINFDVNFALPGG